MDTSLRYILLFSIASSQSNHYLCKALRKPAVCQLSIGLASAAVDTSSSMSRGPPSSPGSCSMSSAGPRACVSDGPACVSDRPSGLRWLLDARSLVRSAS